MEKIKNWLRKSWSKIKDPIIPISVVVIAVSLLYYFVFFLPKFEQEKFYIEQQQKCMDVGEQAYKLDQQEYGSNNMFDPEFGYNKKLNTCIYASGYSDPGDLASGQSKAGTGLTHNCDAMWERWVKNSYTNERIIAIANTNNVQCEWSLSIDSINNFWTKSDSLFSNKN